MDINLTISKFLESEGSSNSHYSEPRKYLIFKDEIRNGTAGEDVVNRSLGPKHAIEVVCSRGEWKILNLLLKSPLLKFNFMKIDSLLCIVAKNLTRDNFYDTESDYKACFLRLLDDPRIDINLTDRRGNTPLHYTVKYKCDELTKLLLARGAYIGLKNLKRKLPIDGIDYQILHDFFDSRMTSNSDCSSPIYNDFEINLDYSFLIKKPNKNNMHSKNTDPFYPIKFISQSEHLKDLITHPLIQYIIWIKSETLSLLFIWNTISLVLYLLTIFYITFFNLDHQSFSDRSTYMTVLYVITRWATYFSIIGFSLYLIVQTVLIVKYLLYKISSYGLWRYLNELFIVLLLIFVLHFATYGHGLLAELKRPATAICILLISINMIMLMITFPKFETITFHFLILKKISRQLCSVLIVYFAIMFAFSLAFYVLDDEIKYSENGDIIEIIQNFSKTFIRVIGLMIGELNLKFESLLILILIFIFLLSIVLMNILQGVVISDIGEIRQTAKLIYLAHRVQMIMNFENYFLRHFDAAMCIPSMRHCLFNLSSYFNIESKTAFTNYVKGVQVCPNRKLTKIQSISRTATPDAGNKVLEWRKINRDIVNKIVAHFQKNDEEQNKLTRQIAMDIILNKINQMQIEIRNINNPSRPSRNKLEEVTINIPDLDSDYVFL